MIWFRSYPMISGKYLECMQRKGHKELLPFDLEPERTLHQFRIEAHITQHKITQHQVDARQIHDRDEPQVGTEWTEP